MCFLRGGPCLRETFLRLTQRFLLRLDLGGCFFKGFRGGIRKSSGLTQRLLRTSSRRLSMEPASRA